MSSQLGTFAACVIAQSLALYTLQVGTFFFIGSEPAIAAIATAILGMLIAITQDNCPHSLVGVIRAPLIALISTVICLSLFYQAAWTWGFAAGVWVLTLALAACRFSSGARAAAHNNLAITLSFLLLCSLPLILSPALQLTQSTLFASSLLALNPVYYLSTLIDYDLLYNNWVYTHTPFSDLRISSVSPLLSSTIYLLVATAGVVLSRLQLRSPTKRSS